MFIAKQKYVAIKTILSAIKNNQAQYARFMNMGPLTWSPFSKIETNNKEEQNRTEKHLITQNCSQALTFKKTQFHELLIFRLVISETVKLQSSFPSGSPVLEQIRLLLQWLQQRGGWSSTSSALSCSQGKPLAIAFWRTWVKETEAWRDWLHQKDYWNTSLTPKCLNS